MLTAGGASISISWKRARSPSTAVRATCSADKSRPRSFSARRRSVTSRAKTTRPSPEGNARDSSHTPAGARKSSRSTNVRSPSPPRQAPPRPAAREAPRPPPRGERPRLEPHPGRSEEVLQEHQCALGLGTAPRGREWAVRQLRQRFPQQLSDQPLARTSQQPPEDGVEPRQPPGRIHHEDAVGDAIEQGIHSLAVVALLPRGAHSGRLGNGHGRALTGLAERGDSRPRGESGLLDANRSEGGLADTRERGGHREAGGPSRREGGLVPPRRIR